MNQLWAPWRMEYLKDHKPTTDCIFCKFVSEQNDKQNLIAHRGTHCFVILNKFPYNNGHVMVVPNEHVPQFDELSETVLKEMNELIKISSKALDQCYKPQGYNLGMNIGEASGAGVKDHLHMHIVPRWNGDTNFMPVLAETKTMPQHISASYEKISEAIRSLVK